MTLAAGIDKFSNECFPPMEGRFRELEKGQSPETLFITCSDSRIDPSLITQTQPGELFVIRNAGNIVPRPGTGELSVEATILYAIDVLKVKRVVVCGHSHCGAVTGLMNLESLEAMPEIKAWVGKSAQVLERLDVNKATLSDGIKENVKLQIEHLLEYAAVSNAVAAQELELEGWVYHFETGQVEFID
ncbi:carbonic anhydrase [Mariniblastus sp.]|nr:carbonic anhydrase [Mariniblastus sp.]